MNPVFAVALNAIPEECWICDKEECERENCTPFQKALKNWCNYG